MEQLHRQIILVITEMGYIAVLPFLRALKRYAFLWQSCNEHRVIHMQKFYCAASTKLSAHKRLWER